jgi:hypothetical protein
MLWALVAQRTAGMHDGVRRLPVCCDHDENEQLRASRPRKRALIWSILDRLEPGRASVMLYLRSPGLAQCSARHVAHMENIDAPWPYRKQDAIRWNDQVPDLHLEVDILWRQRTSPWHPAQCLDSRLESIEPANSCFG